MAPREARAHARFMWWHAFRWRYLARNAHLAYVDQHHRRRRPWLPLLPWQSSVTVHASPVHRVRWPRAKFRLSAYGWDIEARTVPRVGRREFADKAQWLADGMAVHRVTVHQDRPGRVRLACLRTDPLAVPYQAADCPAGTFTATGWPGRLLVGRDESAAWRHLPLKEVTGITVTGLPGAGKSTLLASWLSQLAGCPAVHPLILDGKGSQEWADWEGRAIVLGDDLGQAEDALAAEDAEMRTRHACVRDLTGGFKNAWRVGPTPAMGLRLVVLDECDRFLNAQGYKGSPKDEARARHMTHLVSGLVRRGRSVLFLVILATQTGLADSFGNSTLRGNCALSVAFALRTQDAAVAALGAGIRDYADISPVTFQGPDATGVCTSTLRTGLAPYTRIRCPEITEEAAAARAVQTAALGMPTPESLPGPVGPPAAVLAAR
jgi:hypothetical protein